MRSDSVVLPESMWALMPMLRMRSVFATWFLLSGYVGECTLDDVDAGARNELGTTYAARCIPRVLGRAPYLARARKASWRQAGGYPAGALQSKGLDAERGRSLRR